MKKVFLISIIIFLLISLWLGKAGSFLSSCFLEVSNRYEKYPVEYSTGAITKQEFEQIFLSLRNENINCQEKTRSKFLIPSFMIKFLTTISTEGNGLP